MKYTTANAFRVALESRLLTRSREDSIPLIRLRKLVVFDRLIARLMVVAPDRWVLKGAVALQFRAGPEYRTKAYPCRKELTIPQEAACGRVVVACSQIIQAFRRIPLLSCELPVVGAAAGLRRTAPSTS